MKHHANAEGTSIHTRAIAILAVFTFKQCTMRSTGNRASKPSGTQIGLLRTLLLALLTSCAAIAPAVANGSFIPWQGHWLNWAEGGSGYNITVQNGVMMMTIFTYKPSGDSEWYLASGNLTGSGRTFSGTLNKYRNGQCIGCTFTNGAVDAGYDGSVGIVFTDETHATLSLPNGRTTDIVPFQFGQGPAPDALLGEWIYTYDVGSDTLADRYNFNRIIAGTANGDGLALDGGRLAACELQVRGDPSLVGKILCVQIDASAEWQKAYLYRYGIDQTYDGLFMSASRNVYPMKGFLTGWKNDQCQCLGAVSHQSVAFRNSEKAADDSAPHGGAAQAMALPGGMSTIVEEMAARIREVRLLQ